MWKLALALSVCLPLAAAQTPPAPDATTGKAAPNVTVTEARPHKNYLKTHIKLKGKAPTRCKNGRPLRANCNHQYLASARFTGPGEVVCVPWVREGGRLSSIIKYFLLPCFTCENVK